MKELRNVEPGVVVTVRDWPGTRDEKFVVLRLVENPKSPWPHQVEARSASSLSVRTFPLELCTVDERATKAREKKQEGKS
jgi:hypothetical protein